MIIVEKLGMRRVAARLVPIQLNFRVQIAMDMLDRANSDPNFMGSIITVDETWVYEYDMQTSQQSSEWRKKRAETEKTSTSTSTNEVDWY